jgi:hypothetical protein
MGQRILLEASSIQCGDVSTSTRVAPGQLYVFLSEGTLLITSPHSKPALGGGPWSTILPLLDDGTRQRQGLTNILVALALSL